MADVLGKKISELAETTDLAGLYTIGSDKNNQSKKVSLQFVKEASDYANAQGDYAKTVGDTVQGNTGVDEYPVFSASKQYAVGDVVRYEGRLYKFTALHAAGAWVGTNVVETSIKAEADLKLAKLESEIEVFPTNILENKWVSAENVVNGDRLFDIFEYEFSNPATRPTHLSMYFASGGGYAVMLDADNNVVWSAQTKGDTYLSKWVDIAMPESGVLLRITQAKWTESHFNAFPIRVMADRQSTSILNYFDRTNYAAKYISGVRYTISNEGKNIIVEFTVNKFSLILGETAIPIPVDSSYTIDPYCELYVDLATKTVKVGNYMTTKRGVVLLFNENGIISYGLLADLENATRITKVNDNISDLFKRVSLSGKNVLFIGDSITDTGYYVQEITDRTGCISYNRGSSGSTLATGHNSMCDRLDMESSDLRTESAKHKGFPSSADYIFILAGINDWGRLRSQPFGDFNEAITKDTFCGALKYMFRGLKLKYPNAKIFALNLLHTYSPDKFPAWNELTYEDNDETKAVSVSLNKVGKSLYDYREAISTCAKMYGIPVIDLFNVGFSAILEQDRARYYEDGLHPSAEGGQIMADFILNQIATL